MSNFEDLMDMLSPNKIQKKDIKDFDGHFYAFVPFDQFNTPDIPVEILPPVIAEYVQNVAEVLSVPPAMPIMATLGMISCAVSKKFVVSPKSYWHEPINIYTAIAMPPASNKTQVLKKLLSPIEEWEEKEAKRISPVRKEKKTELNILNLKLQKNQNSLKQGKLTPGKEKDAVDQIKKLEKEILEKEAVLPVIPQVYTNDATMEAIADLIHEQGDKLALISDEGGILEIMTGLYSQGNANIDILLKGIDGGSVRVKRRSGREYNLHPFLTIVLLVQPQILINMGQEKAFIGTGALERYLYALPVCSIGYRDITNRQIDDKYETRYSQCISNLLDIPMPEKPYVLKLDHAAHALWMEWRKEIEKELRPDGKLYICRGWGGKLAGFTLRVAGLLHAAAHVGYQYLTIEKSTMEKAIKLMRLLMEHAVAVYGLMGIDQESKDARDLFDWLKTQRVKMLSKSEIINAFRNRQMGKKDRLKKAIGIMIERNILSNSHWDITTKKPTECYFINPAIFD